MNTPSQATLVKNHGEEVALDFGRTFPWEFNFNGHDLPHLGVADLNSSHAYQVSRTRAETGADVAAPFVLRPENPNVIAPQSDTQP